MKHREPIVHRDGWLWCYELTPTQLRLKLFRCIPLARIHLDQVRYIRHRSAGELLEWWRDFFLRPFRSWYWPHPLMSHRPVKSAPYIIRTRSGRRIYLRLRGKFHYALREAVGHNRFKQSAAVEAGPLDCAMAVRSR